VTEAARPHPPLIGIVGWSGSGKTTLIERLIATFSACGVRIATIKHAHHPLRPHDGATDGERHARAGAVAVVVIAPEAWEISGIVQSGAPPELTAMAARLGPADLILVEGHKSAAIPKIEVRSLQARSHEPLAANDSNIVAIAADHPVEAEGLPVFSRDDAEGLANLIEARFAHLLP
jgi:molybdopterin-guanine dinucleotide biosynthesis adapter protein